MSDDPSAKERRILRVMRQVLGNIVKDATPQPGTPHPFQESTIASIRDLFALISERERELALEAGLALNEKPYYADEPQAASVVTLHRPDKDKLN